MSKFLIFLLTALLLPNSVEANWFGKYNSRYDANDACERWMLKGFKYTYKVMERKGYGNTRELFGSPYTDLGSRHFDIEVWKREYDEFKEQEKEANSLVEKTKSGFSRSCLEEKETNQFIGRAKSCLKKKEYSVEEWKKLFELKSCEKRKYFKY